MVSDTSATAMVVALGSGIVNLCRPTQVSRSETDMTCGHDSMTATVFDDIQKPKLGDFLYTILFIFSLIFFFLLIFLSSPFIM